LLAGFSVFHLRVRPNGYDSGGVWRYSDSMEPPEKRPLWAQIGDYASLGVALPATTVTGYFLGVLLDHLFGTHFLYIVFLLVGIVAGFFEIYRVVSRNSP
jgi:F0F1-type ATP synthase assembly protein I